MQMERIEPGLDEMQRGCTLVASDERTQLLFQIAP